MAAPELPILLPLHRPDLAALGAPQTAIERVIENSPVMEWARPCEYDGATTFVVAPLKHARDD